jgi:hypothetical protein
MRLLNHAGPNIYESDSSLRMRACLELIGCGDCETDGCGRLDAWCRLQAARLNVVLQDTSRQ